MKRVQIRRHRPLRARRRRGSPGTPEQRRRFKDATLRWASWECAVADDGEHGGDLQAHHVTTQEAIRRWCRDRHVDNGTRADLLWDPANGMCVCERHHNRHTLAIRRLPVYAIPATAYTFANALGLGQLIDRYYRTRDEADGA